ncbi:MAG: plasmid replication/partition related protein [Stenotrophomonas nitritireducens]|uniref:plasmid replication/partition related protein n=1 Tax=Stenotrophomonas nitritireducens TaxID=83617 RepID=UPI001AD4897C|nr:plasmid replication/partition related protein [Stenotrophomonas nitritireducens]MBN8790833.1 plasmid replication/partition related protein [Stenotrophomonas nitritireducens]MBN8796776.1 plasmid replication/partition related protein [Stenotrophomonas nitritireducens]
MDIIVNEELKAYIDPLTADEHDALERSLLAEGCRDALVLWGNVLIDGHNRYGICMKHGLPFNTVQNTRFQSMEDVHLWMIEQHLGRRSVSDFQRGVLALRKRAIVEARHRAEQEQLRRESEGEAALSTAPDDADADTPPWEPAPKLSKAEIAREAKLSASQVSLIEKISAHAAQEVIEAVKAGDISLSAAAVVASLPEEEQRAAAQGGKSELKEAAKRVRESRRRPKAVADSMAADAPQDAPAQATVDNGEVEALRQRVASLTAENQALRMELDALRARMAAATEA